MSPQCIDRASVLERLYRKHEAQLAPLPEALRGLRQLSEEFEQITGAAVAPWELWESIMLGRATRAAEPF